MTRAPLVILLAAGCLDVPPSSVEGGDGPLDAAVDGAADPVPEGLVGHWRLDEVDGTVALDSSASDNHGLLVGGAGRTPGVVGGAVSLDGIDDEVVILDPVDGSLDPGTGSFSFALWIWVVEDVAQWDRPLAKGGAEPDSAGYDFEFGTTYWGANVADGTQLVHIEFDRVHEAWTHFAVVIDRETERLLGYQGGVLVDLSALAGFGSVSNSLDATIGSADGYAFARASIDDVRIYDRALSDAEVVALAGQGP